MDAAVLLALLETAGAAADPHVGRVARRVAARLMPAAGDPAIAPGPAGIVGLLGALDWETGDGDFATAEIFGPAGIAPRDDVWIGATRIAPGAAYPLHRHAPEEIYLFLTAGAFFDGDRWRCGAAGAWFRTPPGRPHALRAGVAPLLALWFLPLDPNEGT